MLERLRYAWNNIRIITKYTPEQAKRLQILINFYKQYINPEIEEESFLTVNEEGFPTKKVNQEHLTFPAKIVHNSPLATFVNSIISEIAQYIEWRLNRKDAYSNDPQILFCIEVIRWVKQSLLKSDIKLDSTKEEVKRWKKFLNNLSNQDVFPTEEAVDKKRSLFATIKNIENLLDACDKRIDFELSRVTLGDLFEQLANGCQNLTNFLFDYLINVLSDQKVPTNLTLLSLYNYVISDEIQDLLVKFKIGELALSIAYDPCIRDTFFIDESSQLINSDSLVTFNQHTRLSQIAVVSNFIDTNGMPNENLAAQLNSTENKKSGIINFPAIHEIKKETSITPETQKQFIGSFIRLHGFTKILGRLTLIFREAGFLAKSGGEILLYKLAYQNIITLLNYFKNLIRLMETESNRNLKTRLDKIHVALKVAKVPDNVATWIANYQFADSALGAFNETISSVRTICGKVDGILLNFDARILEIKSRLENFIASTNALTENYQWLGIGNENSPNYQITSYQITSHQINRAHQIQTTTTPALEYKKPAALFEPPSQVPIKVKKEKTNISNRKTLGLNLDASSGSRFNSRQIRELMPVLIGNKNLLELNFSKHYMTPESTKELIKVIRKNKTLIQVVLSHNSIDIAGIRKLTQVIAEHPALQAIDFSHTYMGHIGIGIMKTAFSENTRLKKINLSHNSIKPEGFNDFVGALNTLCNIEELFLSHNLLGLNNLDIELKIPTLLKILSTTLVTFDLSHNQINFNKNNLGQQVANIFIQCKKLKSLYLQGNKLDDVTCQLLFDHFSRNQKNLILGLNPDDCSEKWWQSFSHLPNVTITSDNDLNDVDRKFLQQISSAAPQNIMGLLNERTRRLITLPLPQQFGYNNGNTPLHIAVDRLDIALIQVLCRNIKDFNLRNFYGDNLLHTALLSRLWSDEGYAVLDYLLDKVTESDINAINHDGQTPLIIATETLNSKAVEKLIAKGALTEIVCHRNLTAEKIALDKANNLRGEEQSKAENLVKLFKHYRTTQSLSQGLALNNVSIFRNTQESSSSSSSSNIPGFGI